MEERKFIRLKKEEFGIKEYIKRNLGKGKISKLDIEYTPLGERIVISTSRPGLVIGRRGEKIQELTEVLKTRFKLENPHIEIKEIENPLFDEHLVADDIAMALERMGNLRFKVIAYKKLQEIMKAGALGCEIRLTGKLPSERARSWRFAEGYLKKAGEPRKEISRAQTTALTKTGIIGIKVAIMAPTARIYDKIDIDDEMKARISAPLDKEEPKAKEKKKQAKEKAEKKGEEKQKEKEQAVEKLIQEKPTQAFDKTLTKTKETEKTAEIMKKGEVKVIKETKLKPEEDGTAMKIEEEIEEGVPQDIIDEELKEAEEEKQEKQEEKKQDKKPKEKPEKTEKKKEKDNKPKKPSKKENK
jgi:small subunit ribosomal protein S3